MKARSSVKPTIDEDTEDKSKKEKDETSPSMFLPSLKEFNIEHAKYKHYGHSMTSHQLEKIMQGSPEEREETKKKAPNSFLSYANQISSPLESPKDYLAKCLELPPDKSYSEAIISKMLHLRIEQERSKQLQDKIELARVVSQLICEAKSHGISGELIRRLFIEEDNDEYRSQVLSSRRHSTSGELNISSIPGQLKHKLDESVKSGLLDEPLCTPSPNKSPAAGSQSAPASGSPTTADSTTASHVSHSRENSQYRSLPPLVHTKHESQVAGVGEAVNSIQSTSGAESGVITASGTESRPSPMPMMAQPVYPMYYTQLSDNTMQQQQGHTQNNLQGEEPEQGSPSMSHRLPTSIVHSSPQYGLTPGVRIMSQGAEHFQHPQHQRPPYYYINSSPGGAPGSAMVPSQYFIPPPPLASGMLPWAVAQAPQEKKRESDESSMGQKKPRTTKSEINFMITTPKNPPAKKYNK